MFRKTPVRITQGYNFTQVASAPQDFAKITPKDLEAANRDAEQKLQASCNDILKSLRALPHQKERRIKLAPYLVRYEAVYVSHLALLKKELDRSPPSESSMAMRDVHKWEISMAMSDLHKDLDLLWQLYQKNHEDMKLYYLNQALEKLNEASRGPLSYHSGFKQFLANLCIALTGIGLIYLLIAGIHKIYAPKSPSWFYNPRTITGGVIDKLIQDIEKLEKIKGLEDVSEPCFQAAIKKL